MMDLVPQNDLYMARLQRLKSVMSSRDAPALLIVDPVNILYATGASNMTIFSTRVPARYLLVFANGPVVLYDYFGCEHLSADLPTIDEINPAQGLCYISSGGNPEKSTKPFTEEINRQLTMHSDNDRRLAVDRFPYPAIDALRAKGVILSDADRVMSAARKIKLAIELPYMKEAMRRVEVATHELEAKISPGQTEQEIWAAFQSEFIAGGGKYIGTRLLQSGEHTFPYFQECSDKPLHEGDLVCFDTDALGYQGYAADFSRTFVCSDSVSSEQKELYTKAREQLEWNVDLVKPGVSFREMAEHAWQIPEEHQESRYYCIGHGLGMSGEHPNIPHLIPGEPYPLDGSVEAGMVLCIESYIGSRDAGQGVKLEQQLHVNETGIELMSTYPLDDQLGT